MKAHLSLLLVSVCFISHLEAGELPRVEGGIVQDFSITRSFAKSHRSNLLLHSNRLDSSCELAWVSIANRL